MHKHRGKLSRLAMLAGLAALGGCGAEAELSQLRNWLAHTAISEPPTSEHAPRPVAAALPFTPLPYSLNGPATPFAHPSQQLPAQTIDAPRARPPQRGAPQRLENVELASMQLLGTLARGQTRYALLHADGVLHQISPGDYLGRNFGKVEHIAEASIVLEELWPAPDGSWSKRRISLTMQGKSP